MVVANLVASICSVAPPRLGSLAVPTPLSVPSLGTIATELASARTRRAGGRTSLRS